MSAGVRRRRERIRPGALGAAAAAAIVCAAGCGGNTGTVVFVSVAKEPAVTAVTALAATAQNAGQKEAKTFDVQGKGFPLTFTIQPTGRTGDLTLDLSARGASGLERGLASGAVTIVPNQVAHLDLTLQPSDFVVNTQLAGTQRLTFRAGAGGRQISTGADGGFAITFVNDCGGAGECDVFGRIFGPDGTPRQNGITMDDGQFTANLDQSLLSVPAVAVGASGLFMIWESPMGIRGVALDQNAAELNSAETQLSAVPGARDPDVAAFPDGGYVAVWSQDGASGGGNVIHARFLGSDGQPATNPTSGDSSDFTVSTTGDANKPAVATTGSGKGFVVTWVAGTEAYARFYDQSGMPTASTEMQLTDTGASGSTFAARVAVTPDGRAVVGWGANVPSTPTKTGYFVGTFSAPGGGPAGAPRQVATVTPDQASAPAVAVLPDGTLGAVWHDCGTDGDGSGCGIFLQLMRSTGLPIGKPIVVNTTTRGDQKDPAIAPAGKAFVITWSDGSAQPPDTSGGSVRARIFYPDVNPTDGRIGASCTGGTAACGTGLVCAQGSDGGAYCHEKCDTSQAAPCPSGGSCRAGACIF